MVDNKIGFSFAVGLDDSLFFVNNRNGFLMKYNCSQNEMFYLENQIDEFIGRVDACAGIVENNNILYFIENGGKKIYEYSLLTGDYDIYRIDVDGHNYGNTIFETIYNGLLYIFSSFSNECIIFDISTKKYVKKILLGCDSYRSLVRYGNEVIIVSDQEKRIYIYDLEFDKEEQIHLDEKINSLRGAVLINDNVFICHMNGKVSKYNIHNRSINVVCNTELKNGVSSVIMMGNELLILPTKDNVIKFNIEQNLFSSLDDLPKDLYYEDPFSWSKFTSYIVKNNIAYLNMRRSRYMISVDQNSKKISLKKPELMNSDYFIQYLIKNRIMYEGECSLNKFIENI